MWATASHSEERSITMGNSHSDGEFFVHISAIAGQLWLHDEINQLCESGSWA
jgi:hypothetical protein